MIICHLNYKFCAPFYLVLEHVLTIQGIHLTLKDSLYFIGKSNTLLKNFTYQGVSQYISILFLYQMMIRKIVNQIE